MTVRHMEKGEREFFNIRKCRGIHQNHCIRFNLSISKLERKGRINASY